MDTDAVSHLENVWKEIQKPFNIDNEIVLNSLRRCYEILEEVLTLETDPLYMDSMTCVLKSLETQQKLFTSKCHTKNTCEKNCSPVKGEIQENNVDIQKQNRISAIENTIITRPQLSFDDIAGLDDAKQALHEAIIMPFKFPQVFTVAELLLYCGRMEILFAYVRFLFRSDLIRRITLPRNRKPWKRILLYGPPGTGKSRLALALASAITSTFYSISSSDLLSHWVGESEKSIRELFEHACQNNSSSIIFIDEIDSICRKRNMQEEEHTRRFKTELLKQMEGIDNRKNSDKLFLLCATNCPWDLDVAFLRRFQKRIYIPLPDKEARIEMLKIHTNNSPTNMSDEDWDILGEKTELYSGSDIANLTLGALFEPVREMQNAKYWKCLPGGNFIPCDLETSGAIYSELKYLPSHLVIPKPVQLDDFLNSTKTHSKTVSEADVANFVQFSESQNDY